MCLEKRRVSLAGRKRPVESHGRKRILLFRDVTRLDEWREENRGFEFVAVGGGGIGLVAKRGRALCLFPCDERSKARKLSRKLI